TAGSFLRPAPAPAPLDAGSSSPTAAECARLARHGSGLRIPLRSDGPRATRSTNWFRSPELAAHASARARYASDLPDANAVCAQPVPLSSGRAVRPAGVAAPSGSLTADALPPGGPLPPEELPAATAEPRVSVAAPVPENLAELLLGFPWTDHSRRRPECHYIIQYLIESLSQLRCLSYWPNGASIVPTNPVLLSCTASRNRLLPGWGSRSMCLPIKRLIYLLAAFDKHFPLRRKHGGIESDIQPFATRSI